MAGRPRIDLTPFQSIITEKFQNGWTYSNIITYLSESFQIQVSPSTFKRFLQSLNLRREVRTEFSSALLQRIFQLFFDHRLSDLDILLCLRTEGFTVSQRGLEDIRKCYKLWRRQTPEQLQAAFHQAVNFLASTTSDEARVTRDFGREFLFTYMRQRGHIISRSVLYEAYRTVFPEEVANRLKEIRYRRKGWTTPGPNFIWSLDAYDKLLPFGFEIYASIDAYSRYIVWFYVGFSAHTARSVLAQYLSTLLSRGIMPQTIRSDRGTETILTAGSHWYLSQDRTKKAPLQPGQDVPIQFRDCWIFSKSIHNVKIESWWNQLCQAQSATWRAYFYRLQALGLFYNQSLSDRVALLFIFMPLIRKDFTSFVQLWNNHRIRSQKSRPHVVSGQPWKLYHHPDHQTAQDFAQPIDHVKIQKLQNLLGSEELNLDQFLPHEVFQVCKGIMEPIQTFPPVTNFCGTQYPRIEAYNFLRQRLEEYIEARIQPELHLLPKQNGGIEWVKEQFRSRGISIDELYTSLSGSDSSSEIDET
nr:uncharacterized protein CTRU02_05514 [Colletotrichum truncatum]KAF6793958.1 hypothetical protein CTRU02_05514 [Colletotrichum truncatum]